jgi:transglutaminase-like putative cysteine protease
MKLEIVHSTRYRYSGPIAETVMEVRLRPMDGNGQRCLEFDLDVSSGIKPRSYRDGYGNSVHYFNVVRPHTRLIITSRSVVETGRELDDPGESLVQDFLRFRSPVKDAPGIRELASRHPIADPSSDRSVEQALDELTLAISREFTYDRAVTTVYSSVDEVLALRAGVCQDFAHVMIAGLRGIGLPAAYISGYIRTIPPPGKKRLEGADAMHAWVSLWCGEAHGWVGLDPTNGMMIGDDHIVLAKGRDYADISPVAGIILGSREQDVDVKVDVVPRV